MMGYEAFKPRWWIPCPLHVDQVLLVLSYTAILTTARTPTEVEYLMLPSWHATVPVLSRLMPPMVTWSVLSIVDSKMP